MRQPVRIAIALAFVAGIAGPALADDLDTCYDGQGSTAIAACTRLINSGKYKGSNLASAFGQRAVHYKLAEKYEQALADYNVAIRIEPTALRYSNRANVLRLKGETDRALADLVQALRLDPKRATAYANRGLISSEDKHDPDRALADFNNAIAIDPLFTGAYVYRAQLFEKKGDLAKAKADYHQSLAVPPKYSDGQWAHEQARKRLDELEPQR